MSIKIVQLNIWVGNLQREVEKFLVKEDADIVCLQEVFSSPTQASFLQTLNYNSLQSILNKTSYGYVFFSPTLEFSILGEQVQLGNAILSRHTFIDTQTTFTNGSLQKITDWKQYRRNTKNVQTARISINEKSLSIINHHGYHDNNPMGNEKSVKSMQKLAKATQELEGPVVLCGDLNVVPESPAMRVFDGRLRDLTTEYRVSDTLSQFGKVRNVPCDHILVSDDINVKDFTASDVLVSDHKALILEFDL